MTNKLSICKEKPYPLGCYIDYDKSLVVRAVFGEGENLGVTLYPQDGDKETKSLSITFTKEHKLGAIYSARVKGIDNIDKYVSYNYFEDGAYFCDSYAKHVLGLECFGKDVPDSKISAKLDNKASCDTSEIQFDWGDDASLNIPYEDSFVYLLHVRGFTKSSSSGVTTAKRGTFGGIIEKIPYLKSLGVTTLELMPVYEMNEVETPLRSKVLSMGISADAENEHDKLVFSKDGSLSGGSSITKKLNFWGYKKGYYFAPRSAYCENPENAENEFKNFVKTLHENGMELILQFYFDDNESETLIIDALRYWRCTYHVDGFHLKGARLPLRQIALEPLFTDVKIWYEWFDLYDIYGGASLDKRYLGIYNNNFMYSARRFLKSDDNSVNDFLKSMIANGTDHAQINYICDYEGFRLSDLVSYEHKHNEENGENNKDGSDNNLSWNCGIEGRTRKHNILELRKKQMKNILTMLFMAQGTPMLFGGDEFGNSQQGNNNPYCQDNEIGWIDWKALDKNEDILEYVRFLSKLRFSHKFLHEKKPFKMMDYISCGYPDLSCHGKDAWRPDLSGYSHVLGMLYCGLYENNKDNSDFIYVCYNMHWQKAEFALPKLPDGLKWKILSDTDENMVVDSRSRSRNSEGHELILQNERSVRIYVSEIDSSYTDKTTKRKTGKRNNGKN